MVPAVNLCSSILPTFAFDEVVDITRAAGFHGLEVRIADHYHQRLDTIARDGRRIKRVLDQANLELSVLSSYIPLDDRRSIARLLRGCQILGARQARLVLPRSGQAAVVRQALTATVVPAYPVRQEPRDVLASVLAALTRLEQQAAAHGVQLVVELHWGTVMSSFSSAYWLLRDVDPAHIALTFDPANMLVEGKEDWEFGLGLVQPYLANVHVKNVRWSEHHPHWMWDWAPLTQGMVDWPALIALLQGHAYAGGYAIEDFLTPTTSKSTAIAYLREVRTQFGRLYEQASALRASVGKDGPTVAAANR